jgi:hypothetical protein
LQNIAPLIQRTDTMMRDAIPARDRCCWLTRVTI